MHPQPAGGFLLSLPLQSVAVRRDSSPTSGVTNEDEWVVNNRVEIRYCTQCRWLLRAAWMAQELLVTFDQELSELTLKPGRGGVFEVWVDDNLVWSRKEEGRFPEITELKQLVRDRVAPEKDLGHSDRKRDSE